MCAFVQDTINVQELRFGDNDTLSAQVAALVQADWLVLLTDVDYLYTANPRTDPDAKPIMVCTAVCLRVRLRDCPGTVHLCQIIGNTE